MAVGAGSIKRASKLSTEAVEEKKTTAEKTAPKKATAVKTTTKTNTKKTPEKKSTQSKAVVQKPAEALSDVKATPSPKAQQQKNPKQVCRLTEELPIYLL